MLHLTAASGSLGLWAFSSAISGWSEKSVNHLCGETEQYEKGSTWRIRRGWKGLEKAVNQWSYQSDAEQEWWGKVWTVSSYYLKDILWYWLQKKKYKPSTEKYLSTSSAQKWK